MSDSYFIAKAVSLAKKGKYFSKPGVNVGALIVKNNKIIGEGFYERFGGRHAEINAINDVKRKYGKNYLSFLSDSEIFITLEPCSKKGKTGACVSELKKYDFKRVIVGSRDPTQNGLKSLSKHGFKMTNLNDADCIALNKEFFYKDKFNRPFVRAKVAMSADQKSVFRNQKRKWITGTPARNDVQKIRAQSDIILTGAGTINIDKPSLNVRLENIISNKAFSQPERFVFSSSLNLNWEAPFFTLPGKKVVVTSKRKFPTFPKKVKELSFMYCNKKGDAIDPKKFINKIAKKNINNILIESGPKLFGTFSDENLIDEYIFYISRERLKEKALHFYEGKKNLNFFDSKQFVIVEECYVGKDKKIILRKK